MDAPGQVPASINCPACGAVIDLSGRQGFTHVECPQCETVSVVPMKFGNFLLLNPLGVGGMGTVYRAVDLSLNRHVALKILRKKLSASPEFIANFAREARAAAAVNHPNIAQVYSFSQQDGEYYLAMELLERGSLDDRLSSMGKLPERDVLEIGLQIAQGLRAAHQRGLLHLDIKPANILFNTDGVPKLVDFGLARIQEPGRKPDQPTAEAPQQIWGTPYYVAPEKLHGQPEDFRSDIYSLGATLFHALAGRPPFDAETASEVVSKQAIQPAYSLKTFAPTVHNFTAHVIGRMLAKNPAERYQSYDELIRDLNEALAAVKLAQSPHVIVASTGERFSILSLLGTILGLVACVAVAWYVWTHILHPTGQAPAGPATTTSGGTKGPPPIPTEQIRDVDFNEEVAWVKAWNVATLQLAQGRYSEAYLAYDSALHLLRTADQLRARQWIYFFQGIAMQAANRPAEAIASFTRAVDLRIKPHVPATITTGNFVDTLAQVMMGGLPLSALEEARPSMPAWAGALSALVSGFKHLEQHDFAAAAAAFRQYAEMEKDPSQPWAFHLQPLAERLAKECDRTIAALAELDAQVLAGKFDEAVEQANDLRQRTTLPGLSLLLAKKLGEIEQAQAEKRRQQEQLAAAELQRQRELEERERAAAASDQQLIASQDTALAAALANYDYAAAVALFDALAPKIQTATGQTLLQQRLAGLQLLIKFKEQLTSDFPRSPYDSTQLQTRHYIRVLGRLNRATNTQLIFLTQHGEIVAEWRDLTPTSLMRMAEYYISTLGRTERPEEVARRHLLLATFCQYHGLERAAAAHLAQALKLHPALRPEIQAVFGKDSTPPPD